MTQALLLPTDNALHNCRVFASYDMAETQARISRLMQPYHAESAGHQEDCQSYLDFLPMPSMGIAAIKQLGRMKINVAPIEGFHFLIFCVKGRALLTSYHGSTTIDARTGLYFGPGQRFQGELPEDCVQLVVRIDAAAFQAYAGSRNASLSTFIDLARPSLAPWLNLLSTIISDQNTIDLLLRNRRVALDYEQLFMSLLFSGQGYVDDYEHDLSRYRGAAPASIRRAEMFIEAHARDPLRLDDIANAANVPTRTLLEGFRRFRQTSPVRFLRDVRLDLVREALLEGMDGVNVTGAAIDAGFRHLGRFSQDYVRRFGEKPSETLARATRRGKGFIFCD
ncbi:AraC family transcriptional regulator (plasmid) [Sphingobium sp. SJ10-10]|uniref:AraC family transcriptional regulator n=1 Tax=Sphingobium sp. SJ10-10 TaxID=3114999 RepID=UPI002E1978F8|nr:AraC family transcriptional regulator [Sphingobium sp. SJ10-10]